VWIATALCLAGIREKSLHANRHKRAGIPVCTLATALRQGLRGRSGLRRNAPDGRVVGPWLTCHEVRITSEVVHIVPLRVAVIADHGLNCNRPIDANGSTFDLIRAAIGTDAAALRKIRWIGQWLLLCFVCHDDSPWKCLDESPPEWAEKPIRRWLK